MSQSESRRVAHCMYVEIELKKKKKKKEKKKKEILILKVWLYGNSVKLRQSPTHAHATSGNQPLDLQLSRWTPQALGQGGK